MTVQIELQAIQSKAKKAITNKLIFFNEGALHFSTWPRTGVILYYTVLMINESNVFICILFLIMLLLMYITVKVCDSMFDYRIEMAGCTSTDLCGESYEIKIEVNLPVFYENYPNIPMSSSDSITYVIELRESDSSELNVSFDWVQYNIQEPSTPSDQLRRENNDPLVPEKTLENNFYGSGNLSRLLYYTHSASNSLGTFYGETPDLVTSISGVPRYFFTLRYNYEDTPSLNWNTNSKLKIGNYIHARITTILTNEYNDINKSEPSFLRRGKKFNDLLSLSALQPEAPRVLTMSIGVVLGEDALVQLHGNSRPIDESLRRIGFESSEEEGYLKVPLSPYFNNFDKGVGDSVSHHIENCCERKDPPESDGVGGYVCENTFEVSYPEYSVLSQDIDVRDVEFDDLESLNDYVEELKLTSHAYGSNVQSGIHSGFNPEFIRDGLLQDGSTIPFTYQNLIYRLMSKLTTNKEVGAIFISSTVLHQRFSPAIHGSNGLICVQYKLFKNLINEDDEIDNGFLNIESYIDYLNEYMDTDVNYTDIAQEDTLKWFGWMGPQEQVGGGVNKYYGGNLYPLVVNDAEIIKRSFKGFLYVKTITVTDM